MNNVKEFFYEIENNPNSEKAKQFKEQIYKEYKQKSLNFNAVLEEDKTQKKAFLQAVNEKLKEENKQIDRIMKLKDIYEKIDNDGFKDIALPEKGNYKYAYYLEQLVKFSKNEELKRYVKGIKDNEINSRNNE